MRDNKYGIKVRELKVKLLGCIFVDDLSNFVGFFGYVGLVLVEK